MKKATKVILAISTAGTLAAFGVSQFVSAQSPSPVNDAIEQDGRDETDEDEANATNATELQRLATVTLLQAVQTVEQAANAPAFSAELERENGQVVYAVMVGEQEFLIDASNGQVIATEAEREAAIALQPLATITLRQAVQAAETSANAQAYKAELETENGGLVYAIEIDRQEIVIDAGDGRILYTEVEGQEDSEQAEANRPRSSIQVPERN